MQDLLVGAICVGTVLVIVVVVVKVVVYIRYTGCVKFLSAYVVKFSPNVIISELKCIRHSIFSMGTRKLPSCLRH